MEDLPRTEAHILDGGDMLLETHATEVASLMADFCARTRPRGWYHYDTIQPREAMANVLVRDLDAEVLKQLKAAAKANGRSLQAEIHDALRRASTRHLAETRRLSARWLNRLSRARHSDSADLIRRDRDSR
jgi:plasmid stability protein